MEIECCDMFDSFYQLPEKTAVKRPVFLLHSAVFLAETPRFLILPD